MALRTDPPSQIYTFLFTDLEGSTRLWEHFPGAMKSALERHDTLLHAAVEGANGRIFKNTGDGMLAVFSSTLDGVRACLTAQRALHNEPWGETGPLRVRMGLHTGEAQPRAGDFYGPALNRAARLMAVAHGGQVLLSEAVAGLVNGLLLHGAALRDLGEHRLRGLDRPEHIFQLLHPDLVADFPPLAALDLRANNLPAQATALIGREDETEEIVRRLNSEEVRLVTLTGPGGIGKTRLALHAAADLLNRFQDGVYFVDLSPIRDPESVPAAIARTVGLRETSERSLLDELKGQLRSKHMLLLLDNFEQVTGAAPKVVELLRDCPKLKELVTSREALHVRGEHIFQVPPLALPSLSIKRISVAEFMQFESVRLFVERAQAVKSDFKLTDENAPVVAEICSRLDGLPLAIELAAARIRLFSPQALLERLGSRLQLLRGGACDFPARQQALRDTIDWSYELLDTGEQKLFQLLSVFVGCTMGAVEGVALSIENLHTPGLDILDGLGSLLDKSLLRQVNNETDEPRLLMLETIREYAAERLQQDAEFSAAAHRAHAAYFADFTQRPWDHMTGPEREAALSELASDIENVRTTWRYWVEQKNLEQLRKLFNGLWLLCDVRGWYHAAADMAADLLNFLSSTPSTPALAQEEIALQTSLARALLAIKGYTPEVEAAYARALELAGIVGEIPQLFPVLRGLSILYMYRSEFAKGIRMGEQILSLAERYDDDDMRLEGNLVLGSNIAFLESLERGLQYLEKAIAYINPSRPYSTRLRLGNNPGVAAFTTSALLMWWQGFPDRAIERAREGVGLARRLNHPFSMAYAQFHLGLLHLWRQEIDPTLQYAQAVLEIAHEYKFQLWHAVGLSLNGAGLARTERHAEGLTQIRQGVEKYQGLKSPPIFWPLLLYTQAAAYGALGKTEEGLAILDELVSNSPGASFGRILSGEFYRLKGDSLLSLSDHSPAEAEACFDRALKAGREEQSLLLELRAATGLARLAQRQGNFEPARQLLSEVYARFADGFTMADLVAARNLLGQ